MLMYTSGIGGDDVHMHVCISTYISAPRPWSRGSQSPQSPYLSHSHTCIYTYIYMYSHIYHMTPPPSAISRLRISTCPIRMHIQIYTH